MLMNIHEVNLDRMYVAASPLENWRRPPGRPRTTWVKTTQQDLKSMNLSLNEATDVAQNRPLWRLMSTFGATHSYMLMFTYTESGAHIS